MKIKRLPITANKYRIRAAIALAAIPFIFSCACHSANEQPVSLVVTAPATGIIRSVLVEQGAGVDKDAVIMEISVPSDQTKQSQTVKDDKQERAERSARVALAAAEGEAARMDTEVRRIEPLVKKGLASQSELDKARAQAMDAQERVRLARDKANTVTADQRQQSSSEPSEQVMSVRAPAKGIVELNVKAGQRVSNGDAIAKVISRT